MTCHLNLGKCGLVALVVCFIQPASSFFPCRTLPRASWATSAQRYENQCRPGARSITAVGEAKKGSTPTQPKYDRSAPPIFIASNNVTLIGEFVVRKEGEPTAEELANENLMKIIGEKCTDEQVNWLLWKCLGYRYNADRQAWSADNVFPLWEKKYPAPPDLLGVTRVYEREVDQPVMQAVRALVRAVPPAHKRGIVEQLRPIGFTGLMLKELTPNRTRRSQATNFILYYREQLWGFSLEELKQRKRDSTENEARKPLLATETINSDA